MSSLFVIFYTSEYLKPHPKRCYGMVQSVTGNLLEISIFFYNKKLNYYYKQFVFNKIQQYYF